MKVDAKTLEKCAPLKGPRSSSDVDVVQWGVNTVLEYADCSDKQEKLSRAFAETQKVQNETPKRAWFTWLGF